MFGSNTGLGIFSEDGTLKLLFKASFDMGDIGILDCQRFLLVGVR